MSRSSSSRNGVAEIATGFPGYDSIIRKENGTVGAIVKEHGYATSWFGKNHNTPTYQSTKFGPFDQWPGGMGFEYFYGFVGGDASQWTPNLYRNTTAIYPFEGNPGWNLTTAMADEAIQHMTELKEIAPDKPFFVYYVPGGTHSPHHPTPEWIKKISDMHLFDDGWNKLRDTIFANQKRLGIMPEDAQLTPWPKTLPEWDSLGWEEKKLFIKQADVYGAYLAYTDHEIGRVIQAVEDLGQLDNTLIIYISGDNGASAEGMPRAGLVLADDHGVIMETLGHLLDRDYDIVAAARDGQELVEAARRLLPDVIVADMNMPTLSGLEALRQLKSEQIDAKFVFLTMDGDPALAAEAFRAGAAAYLLKHSATEELPTAIQDVLRGRSYVSAKIGNSRT